MERTTLFCRKIEKGEELLLETRNTTPLIMPKLNSAAIPNLDIAVSQEEVEDVTILNPNEGDILPHPRVFIRGTNRRMPTMCFNFVFVADDFPP